MPVTASLARDAVCLPASAAGAVAACCLRRRHQAPQVPAWSRGALPLSWAQSSPLPAAPPGCAPAAAPARTFAISGAWLGSPGPPGSWARREGIIKPEEDQGCHSHMCDIATNRSLQVPQPASQLGLRQSPGVNIMAAPVLRLKLQAWHSRCAGNASAPTAFTSPHTEHFSLSKHAHSTI